MQKGAATTTARRPRSNSTRRRGSDALVSELPTFAPPAGLSSSASSSSLPMPSLPMAHIGVASLPHRVASRAYRTAASATAAALAAVASATAQSAKRCPTTACSSAVLPLSVAPKVPPDSHWGMRRRRWPSANAPAKFPAPFCANRRQCAAPASPPLSTAVVAPSLVSVGTHTNTAPASAFANR